MILPTTIEPSTPEFSAICRSGVSSALSTMLMPACTSGLLSVILPTAFLARSSATPPPGAGAPHRRPRPLPLSAGGAAGSGPSGAVGLSPLPAVPGGAADADPRHAAGKLGQPLLEFLAIIVRRGVLDLRLDLADAGFD